MDVTVLPPAGSGDNQVSDTGNEDNGMADQDAGENAIG